MFGRRNFCKNNGKTIRNDCVGRHCYLWSTFDEFVMANFVAEGFWYTYKMALERNWQSFVGVWDVLEQRVYIHNSRTLRFFLHNLSFAT